MIIKILAWLGGLILLSYIISVFKGIDINLVNDSVKTVINVMPAPVLLVIALGGIFLSISSLMKDLKQKM